MLRKVGDPGLPPGRASSDEAPAQHLEPARFTMSRHAVGRVLQGADRHTEHRESAGSSGP